MTVARVMDGALAGETVSPAKVVDDIRGHPRLLVHSLITAGMDVARKVVILGRVAGLDTSLDTLLVENVVPKELQV